MNIREIGDGETWTERPATLAEEKDHFWSKHRLRYNIWVSRSVRFWRETPSGDLKETGCPEWLSRWIGKR